MPHIFIFLGKNPNLCLSPLLQFSIQSVPPKSSLGDKTHINPVDYIYFLGKLLNPADLFFWEK